MDFTLHSITQITEKLIEEILKTNITDGLTTVAESLKNTFDEFLSSFFQIKLEELDQNIFNNPEYRQNWNVLHKDVPRTIKCKFGVLKYKRRYYKNSITGANLYLADVLAKVEKGDRVETGLTIELTNLTTDNSYQKSSNIACKGQVSKQTVMKKTRLAKELELEEKHAREDVEELHIQADEDHVSMQDGSNAIVKLAVLHERSKKIKKKTILPHKMHYASYKEKPEDFWCRISEGIIEQYGNRDNLKVYIHGDGASWIKTGLEWIPNSTFILDRFHLHKYVNKLNNFKYINQVWQYLRHEDYKDLKVFIDTIVANDEIDENTGKEIYRYLKNNKEGIKNLLTLPPNIVKSCAEAQVSHVLSDRLSRKPCAWRQEGLESITQLRMFILNGGTLKPEHFKQVDPVIEEHKSKIIEMRKKLAPTTYYKNLDISKYIPKRKDNLFLKEIARIS